MYVYVLEKIWQSAILQANCEMNRPDAEITSFTRNAAASQRGGAKVRRFGALECGAWLLLMAALPSVRRGRLFLAKRKAKILVLLRSCATNGTLA